MKIYIVVDAETNEYYDAFATKEEAQKLIDTLTPDDEEIEEDDDEWFELMIVTKTL